MINKSFQYHELKPKNLLAIAIQEYELRIRYLLALATYPKTKKDLRSSITTEVKVLRSVISDLKILANRTSGGLR